MIRKYILAHIMIFWVKMPYTLADPYQTGVITQNTIWIFTDIKMSIIEKQ
jgi:hypothetical protein